MAITTLPYPNMDFVPLDILTAEELDHIVANIEAVNSVNVPKVTLIPANGSVTLPVGNYTHHICGAFSFTTASASGGAGLHAVGALTGNIVTHRIMCETNVTQGGAVVTPSLTVSDGQTLANMASGNGIGATSGRITFQGDIIVNSNKLYLMMNYQVTDHANFGTTSTEATLRSSSQQITITPYRSNGTASFISGSVTSVATS